MVAGVNQVGTNYAPQNNGKNRVLKGAAIAAGAAGCGYMQHNIISKEIKAVEKKCNDATVRQELKNFWKDFKDGEKFYEDAVKRNLEFNKKYLKDLKKFYKGATFGAAALGAAFVSFLLYLPKLAKSSKNKQNNI